MQAAYYFYDIELQEMTVGQTYSLDMGEKILYRILVVGEGTNLGKWPFGRPRKEME
jgi:hypothetical protein